MAKGDTIKKEIAAKLAEAFGDRWIGEVDKKYYISGRENGETIQIAVALTCPKKMIVSCGSLDENQIQWFKKLYVNGLGEFFYINGIKHIDEDNFIDIIFENDVKEINNSNKKLIGNLIPVGGGKDSNVTMEILSNQKDKNTAFIVNPRGATIESVRVAGLEENLITVQRKLD